MSSPDPPALAPIDFDRPSIARVFDALMGGQTNYEADRRRIALEQLRTAGVRVLVHNSLHAKVYLMEEANRCCWIVGSSNMTGGGLADNAEVSLRGFHPADYGAVHTAVTDFVRASAPF